MDKINNRDYERAMYDLLPQGDREAYDRDKLLYGQAFIFTDESGNPKYIPISEVMNG